MIWIYIGLAIGLIIALIVSYDEGSVGFALFALFFIGGIGALCGVLVGLFASEIIKEDTLGAPVLVSELELVRLEDSTAIEGKFSGGIFLSRGYIGEKQVFNFYKKVGETDFQLASVNANVSTVREVADTPPSLGTYESCPSDKDENFWILPGLHEPCVTSYVITVPPGSVTSEIVLDAK